MEKTKADYEMELYNILAQENSGTIYSYIIENWTPKAIPLGAEAKPASDLEERENILLSDLIKHLRFDFEEGEIISYKIKVKQPKSIREIRYPAK